MPGQEVATAFRGRKGVALVRHAGGPRRPTLGAAALGEHSVDAAALQRAHLAALVRIYDSTSRAPGRLPAGPGRIGAGDLLFPTIPRAVRGVGQLAGEIDSGSIRYWTVRAPRGGIAVGKAAGLWAIVSLVTIGVQVAITVVAIVDAPR